MKFCKFLIGLSLFKIKSGPMVSQATFITDQQVLQFFLLFDVNGQ